MSSGLRGAGGADLALDLLFGGGDLLQRPASVTGKERLGQDSRGQSNFGKYCVLRGSAVLVSESV